MLAERVMRRRKDLSLAEALWEKADTLLEAGRLRKGLGICKKAAHLGNESAQILLGNCYSNNAGIPYNFRAARRWYLRAYRRGSLNAANNLGHSYRMRGDLDRALLWLTIAISPEDLSPHLWIGKIFLSTAGLEALAIPHLKIVAEQGVPDKTLFDGELEEAQSLLKQLEPSRQP